MSNHQTPDTGSRSEALASRRRFLRGVGASIALPAFASLGIPRWVSAKGAPLAATTAAGAPMRAAFLYFPNGAIPGSWWPGDEGSDFRFSPTLEPLDAVRNSIQVMGGLNQKSAEAGPDGAGDHARASGSFLTGVRMRKSATDIHAGISIDQVIAQAIGDQTRFPSLELSCDGKRKSGTCDSGYSCAYQFNLAWSGPTTPLPPENNPRLIFERLFGTGKPGERQASLQQRRQEQRSILDFVLEDARSMERRLGRADNEKLDQYLVGVRDIEKRIERAERLGDGVDPAQEAPDGIPLDYAEYLQLMFDMMILAFQTDSTRVSTFLLAHDGSNRSFDQIGITEGHHDLSHHQNRPEWVQKVAEIDLFYVRQLSKFLQKMEAVKDADGSSLLHNSMIVYGSGNADGNRHTHSNLPIVLAGRAGGAFSPGRYVKHGSKPLTNLFLTMADNMGVPNLDRFGDSDARLTDV